MTSVPLHQVAIDADLASVGEDRPAQGEPVRVVRVRLVVGVDGLGGTVERSTHEGVATGGGAVVEPRPGEAVLLGPSLALASRWPEIDGRAPRVVFEGFCEEARASTLEALLRVAARDLVTAVARACVATLGRLGRDPWRHVDAGRLGATRATAATRLGAAGVPSPRPEGDEAPEAAARVLHEAILRGLSSPAEVATGLGLSPAELQDLFVAAGLPAPFDL